MCKKLFPTPSKLNAHKNRKNPCGTQKKIIKCDICNIAFVRLAHKITHENTKKHFDNASLNADLKNNQKTTLEAINDELKSKINDLDTKNDELKSINSNLSNKINNLDTKNDELKSVNSNLSNKIKNLEIEIQNLKNDNEIHPNNESIYIIHSAQHINTNIYKIGRTKNIIKRISGYPKGSKILYTYYCINSKLIESNIITYLKNTTDEFNQIIECGREYFQCDLSNLNNAIIKFLS